MNTHVQHTRIQKKKKSGEGGGAHLLPTLDLVVISKRRVGAKQPRIGMAAILSNDALCLLLARRPRLLERIARAKELFPAIRLPRLESRLVDANHVAWVGDAGGTGPGPGAGGGRAAGRMNLRRGLRLCLLCVRIEFGKVAGRDVGPLWGQVTGGRGGGIWVAGVLLREPAGGLEGANPGRLWAYLPVKGGGG